MTLSTTMKELYDMRYPNIEKWWKEHTYVIGDKIQQQKNSLRNIIRFFLKKTFFIF